MSKHQGIYGFRCVQWEHQRHSLLPRRNRIISISPQTCLRIASNQLELFVGEWDFQAAEFYCFRADNQQSLTTGFRFLFISQVIRTSAKVLAERAGAAQYAVHIEEELSPEEIGGRHDLRKRLSVDDSNVFDDSDYEIYQGVVGRPGIDFPVLTGIPQTTFNCRKFGNGYFADLETECQVNVAAVANTPYS